MEITKHQLKTWPDYFGPVMRGEKPFEIRKNDLDYKLGDYLELFEYDPEAQTFSGKTGLFQVTYITDYAQQPGWVVMGIKPVTGYAPIAMDVSGEEKPLQPILEQVSRDLGGKVQISGIEFETVGGV